MEYDVFISYSHPDKASADAASATLEQAGIRCWIAPRDIVPGMDWGESIVTAITGAKVLVLIFSQHANESPQIKREVERTVGRSFRCGSRTRCRARRSNISSPRRTGSMRLPRLWKSASRSSLRPSKPCSAPFSRAGSNGVRR
jgi:hypothetical protein